MAEQSLVMTTLKAAMACNLQRIQQFLPESYKLTLIARSREIPDADIVMTADDLSLVAELLKQFRDRPDFHAALEKGATKPLREGK